MKRILIALEPKCVDGWSLLHICQECQEYEVEACTASCGICGFSAEQNVLPIELE